MLCGQPPFENQFSTRWQLMRRLNFRDLIRAQRKEERTHSDLKWKDVIKFLMFFGSYWWLRLVCCLGSLADRTSMVCGNSSKNLTITAPTRIRPLSPAPTSPPPLLHLYHLLHCQCHLHSHSDPQDHHLHPLTPIPSASPAPPPHPLPISTWAGGNVVPMFEWGLCESPFPLDPFDNFG